MAMTVLGVDGCKGAWIGALLTGLDVQLLSLADIQAVLAVPEVSIIGIDMPIGLSDNGVRTCDVEARAWLKGKGASGSVFPAPVRAVLDADDYAHARELSLKATNGTRSLSAQSYHLTKAIKSVDDALGDPPLDHIFEVHPEMAFRTIDDRVRDKKSTEDGRTQRLHALRSVMDIDAALSTSPKLPITDALDACAAAWSAQRIADGTNECVGDGSVDARRRPMRICW